MNRILVIACVLVWCGAYVVAQSDSTVVSTESTPESTSESTTGTTDACDADGGPGPAPVITYSIQCLVVSEGDKKAVLTVTRSAAGGVARLDYTVKVKGRRNASSAVPRNRRGRVFFKDGETTATITVPLVNDQRVENTDEKFTVKIKNLTPNKGTIEKDEAILTVLDDD